MLIDTHAHLFWDSFKEDFDEVLKRAIDVGVETFINIGVDPHLSAVASRLETDKGKFYSSVGIHPEEAARYDENTNQAITTDIEILEKIYQEYSDKVVLVGECGLDFQFNSHPNYDPEEKISHQKLKDLQRKLFQAQIDLAKELNLPLTIHCRDDRTKNPENIEAWSEVLEMIKDSRGILHCYSGKEEITKKALELDFLFSFAGNITYKNNQYLRDAISMIPLDRICLETDCPFLPPQSIRGQRNEPSSVKEIAQCIAEIKGITLEEVANQTTKNVKKLLRLA
jgi:TatD DNase family protein